MRLTVNGRVRDVAVNDHESLLELLRTRLHLTGAKAGCERGECGACTVLVNGEPVYACLTLARACEGSDVQTIEGLATGPGSQGLHAVQRAFVSCDAVQCGYCTPGQILAVVALLRRSPEPSDGEISAALSGNLCRCGTYPKIARAVREAAALLQSAGGGAP